MIETKAEVSKDLEKALQALEQAKQRVANEKKKQNEKKRKAVNHHKYIMGGIIGKYFPDCYCYDEDELNCILSSNAARGSRQLRKRPISAGVFLSVSMTGRLKNAACRGRKDNPQSMEDGKKNSLKRKCQCFGVNGRGRVTTLHLRK